MAKSKISVFKNKRVTIMGLGLLGGALNDAIFLAAHGAILTITDLKTAEQLKSSVDKLKKYKNIKFVLGEHRLEDFNDADFILQPGNVPMNSEYLALAKKNGIPVHVSESLFFENLPEGIKTIGVTGTRGKSTTARLIFEILNANENKGTIYLAGNTKGVSTLALLDQVKAGDTVVMELDSWALHGLGEVKKSPNIAVFTNFMTDHQNFYGGGEKGMELYFADKAQIFLNQIDGDEFICSPEILKIVRKKYKGHSGRAIVPDEGVIPKSWKIKILGEHNRKNVSLAITAARTMDVPDKVIKTVVESYIGVPGRLEFKKEIGGVKYFNDTTATTPDAALAAIEAVKSAFPKSGITLISGGTDKGLDFSKYVKVIPKEVKNLILFRGTATEKILELMKVKKYNLNEQIVHKNLSIVVADNMKEAIKWARQSAKKGDLILLSPGAASFGVFKNEYDRGEQFDRCI